VGNDTIEGDRPTLQYGDCNMTAKQTQTDENQLPEDLTFENALEQLETIVRDMEEGQLALADSMTKFEQGMRLAQFCTGKLGETEKKIEILLKQAGVEDGTWAPLEPDTETQ